MARQTKRKRENGQALVEFAFTLPILLLFTAGIFDFGRVFFVYAQSSNQLRRAVREAPVVGYSSGSPSYLDCQNMVDIASNVIGADAKPTVNVYYYKASVPQPDLLGDCAFLQGGGIEDSDLVNGDIIKIISTTEVTPVMISFIGHSTFTFTLEGQRTIVKTFSIGATDCALKYPVSDPNNLGTDADYDGLCDDWELRSPSTQCQMIYIATDDPLFDDGCNLGCEEGQNPILGWPPSCAP